MKQAIDWKISIYQFLVFSSSLSQWKVQVQLLFSHTRDQGKWDIHTYTHTLQQLTPCLLWLECMKLQWKHHWQALGRQRIECVCVPFTLRREKKSVTHSTTPCADSWHGNQEEKGICPAFWCMKILQALQQHRHERVKAGSSNLKYLSTVSCIVHVHNS